MVRRLFGPEGDTVLCILTVVSLFASINALQLMGSRVPYALGRDLLLPPVFAQVNRGGKPVPALFAGTAVAMTFILTGTFSAVLALLAFFFVANYVLAFTALFVKRRSAPDTLRPFRVPGYPFVPALALLGSLVFLVAAVWSDLRHSAIALVLLALTWPAYRILRLWIERAGTN
ncbi:MAG: amino acid permease [Rudaea sp.]